jgi:hypothetical protein
MFARSTGANPVAKMVANWLRSYGAPALFAVTMLPRFRPDGALFYLSERGIDWMVKMKRICVYTNYLLLMMAVSFRPSLKSFHPSKSSFRQRKNFKDGKDRKADQLPDLPGGRQVVRICRELFCLNGD